MSTNPDLWAQVLPELQLQMTQATFDTWIRDSTARICGDQLTVTVKNAYAKDWLENRLLATIKRTVARLTDRPLAVSFVVSREENADRRTGTDRDSSTPLRSARNDGGDGEILEMDRDLPPDCRFSVELVNFDPTTAGFVMTSNYAWHYWQPYFGEIERKDNPKARPVAWNLWIMLRTFPAAWSQYGRPEWPSIETLASMLVCGREKITGRASRGQVGVLSVLQNEGVIRIVKSGSGRDTIYSFRVQNVLPLLTPRQVTMLPPALQERHDREIARCKVDYEEWKQLPLLSLVSDE